MSWEQIKDFFLRPGLWEKVVAGLLVAAMTGLVVWLRRRGARGRRSSETGTTTVSTTGRESPAQVATGHEIAQDMKTDKSSHQYTGARPLVIERVESGATINISVINYQDGVQKSPNPNVRELFAKASRHFAEGRIPRAIETYRRCLELETDHKRLGALNIQIGNCHHELREYVRAAEFYETAAREAQRAGDEEGEASAIASIANTLVMKPTSSAQRSRNLRQAVEDYKRALTVFRREEYPVLYASIQNNLGNAYTDLPAATTEERTENVRKAIECYNAALEICKKDQYPHQFCKTAANLGTLLVSVDQGEACHWLKEAYSLREYLPDQGRRLEKLIREVCKD